MSSSFNIADITDFLTSGAVFTREDGREARVLFLTNTALPEKMKAAFPVQVIYADENDNVLSCGIDRFLKNRTFYNVQPELEARLNELLAAPSTDTDEDVLDLMSDSDEDGDSGDDLVLTVDEDDLETVELKEDEDDIDAQERIVQFTLRHADRTELPSVVDLDSLTTAVASYQQQPGADLRSIQHVLFIKAEAGITPAILDAAFSPVNDHQNQTLEFAVDTEGAGVMGLVNWDTFIGVYPCVFYGSRMYQVVFSAAALTESNAPVEEVAAQAATEVLVEIDAAAPAVEHAVPVAAPAVTVTAAPTASGGASPAAGQVVQVKIATPTPVPTNTAAPQA